MIPREKWHESLTDAVIIDAARRQTMSLDDPGFCLKCGFEQDGCEPDARRYICEACGEKQVYGAEELMFSLDLGQAPDEQAKLWPAGSGDTD